MLSMPFFIQLFMKVQFYFVDVYACQFLDLCVVKGDLINARWVTIENAATCRHVYMYNCCNMSACAMNIIFFKLLVVI